MTKTPEQIAEERNDEKIKAAKKYAKQYEGLMYTIGSIAGVSGIQKAFERGVAFGLHQALEITVEREKAERAAEQHWISVKERLPNLEKTSRSLRRESSCILLVSYGNVYVAHLCEDWTDRSHFIFEACTCNCRAFDMDIDEWKLDQVTHWMPLPAPPKGEG